MKVISQVTELADICIEERLIFSNSYFEGLATGRMSREQFCTTQEQFYFAVVYFARPMAALISRIEDPDHRLDILHNIVEEHGDFHPRKFHKTTFLEFLKTLGSESEQVVQQHVWPEIDSFNMTLMGACLQEPVEIGIGCLGIIEYAFATISSMIAQTVVEKEWVLKKNLVHYNVHADLDKEHAQEFFALLENKPIATVKRGLELGVYIFNRLYEDLSMRCRYTQRSSKTNS